MSKKIPKLEVGMREEPHPRNKKVTNLKITKL
jgi:hypothetical protein